MRIESGELISGIACKRTVGNTAGSLVHVIWHEFGPEATRDFLRDAQLLVNYWLLHTGFSVGVSDMIASTATLDGIETLLSKAKTDVAALIASARSGKLERQPGRTSVESFESQVNDTLTKAAGAAGKLVQKTLLPSNNINAMVMAGSKGNSLNICQIIACGTHFSLFFVSCLGPR